MLVIKEERMQDLVNFGFKLERRAGYYRYSKKNYYSMYIVFADSRDLMLEMNHNAEDLTYELDLLYDLIKNDMVEKEEECR